mgnify:CR=1 FL=1
MDDNTLNTFNAPFILSGCRRSGTTLLTLLLTHHPKIFLAGEMHFVFDYLNAAEGLPSVDFYYKQVEHDRRFLLWNVNFKKLSFTDLVNDFIRQKHKKEGNDKPIVGVCAHDNFLSVLKLWPKAKFVHIVKDPRDVASSYVSAGWAGNVWYGVDPWIKTQTQWGYIKRHLSVDRYIEVKFEDLVEDTPTVLNKICEFMGIDYSQEMFAYTKKYTNYKDVDSSAAYKWKRVASTRDISLVENKVGNLLLESGYQYNLNNSNSNSNYMSNRLFMGWLFIEHLALYLRKKISIYGFGLTLTHILSRRLPFKKWCVRTQKKIDLITNSNLK